jgi:uncharacterized protein (TIGR00730 family)
MGALADAALADGGEVIGVIPEALVRKEIAHAGLTELRVVGSMHERKAAMAELADAFITLPGGLGTLEEFFEVLTWAQLGLHTKPIGLLDVAGFYQPLLSVLDHMVSEGFVAPAHLQLLVACSEPEPLLAALAAGLVVENIAPPRGERLRDAIERGALPVLIVFFAAAGASLQIDALAVIGIVAVAVSVLRMGLLRGATHVAGLHAGVPDALRNRVWMGLVSQAGVTLGLTLIVASEFPTWGSQLQVLSVALIAIHELIGPVLFRSALARAGEIGRMDMQDQALDAAAEPLRAGKL